MKTDELAKIWLSLKQKARQRWSQITEEELDRLSGSSEELSVLLQTRYGYTSEEAQREVDDFIRANSQ